MKAIKTILLILAAISFINVIGAGLYEHIAAIPRWKLAPPSSLTMFQGQYGINPGAFWQKIHPVTLVLLIAALVANWKTGRRKYIFITIAGYAIAIGVTFLYFVPELLSIIHTAYQPTVDQGLVSRANVWEKLSIVRLVYCIGLASILLFSLTKEDHYKEN